MKLFVGLVMGQGSGGLFRGVQQKNQNAATEKNEEKVENCSFRFL